MRFPEPDLDKPGPQPPQGDRGLTIAERVHLERHQGVPVRCQDPCCARGQR